jgi:DNA polymerase-3 subunit gamma/tau
MSLYQKYRPDSLDQVKGNAEIIQTLKNMLSKPESCPHAFLLTGPTGCGKTTLGRIIAKELGCIGSDYREIDSADFRGIDTVREVRRNSQYKGAEGSTRVWLIDECHSMTKDAQEALLKILEDTPAHVYFILCTTEPQKLKETLKGRCSLFQVTTLSESQLFGLLRRIVRDEQETLEKEIYDTIIQESLGHPRNAIQILEQVLNTPIDQRKEIAIKSAAEIVQSIELCRALIRNAAWKEISSILTGLKDQEPEEIRRQVLGYCQAILLKSDNPLCGLIMEMFIEPFYNTGFPGLVFACYSIVKN